MIYNDSFPSKAEAEAILEKGYKEIPGPWANHCRLVAYAAQTIANKCGMDGDRAYVSGLLHDIGYSEFRDFKGHSCHIILGHNIMLNLGYGAIARICLSHSFPIKIIEAYGGKDKNFSSAEKEMVSSFLSKANFNDYEKLIQLCDTLATSESICLMEKRMVDVVRRNGFSEYTVEKWEATFALKQYFNNLCGENIYNFFTDEITTDVLK